MNKIAKIIIIIIAVIGLICSLTLIINNIKESNVAVCSIYIGLADKDTGKQELTNEEALEICYDICKENHIGFTCYEGKGGYELEDGYVVNNTIIFDLLDIKEEIVYNIIDEMFERLNVSAISVNRYTINKFELLFHK